MPTLSLGWPSIVQAIGRVQWLHWFHSSVSKRRAGSRTNADSSTTNNQESPAIQAKLKASSSVDVSSPKSPSHSTGPDGNASTDDEDDSSSDDEDGIPTINDVDSLKKGIIKTSKDEANTSYTILLVGETGVGKSSVMEFIANVLVGKDIDHCDFTILDRTNEQGGSDNQSQTNSARLYKFTSSNGIVVRILDTPGLADTRGLEQDEIHKRSIATQIKEHIDSITAVLILANGTVPRVTVGTDYALSTLSAIFPKALGHNIAFMFTNVLSPLHWNFAVDTVPPVLQDAPQFLLNNPIALQRKYLKLKEDPNMKKRRIDLRNAVKTGEQHALEMLVTLFDWMDGLEPQRTTEIIQPQKVEAKIIDQPSPIGELAPKKAKNSAGMNSKSLLNFFWNKSNNRRRGKKSR